MDRRAVFFLVAAAVCAALYPATDKQHQWVCTALAITYVVLAVASMLDSWSRHREQAMSVPRHGPMSDDLMPIDTDAEHESPGGPAQPSS